MRAISKAKAGDVWRRRRAPAARPAALAFCACVLPPAHAHELSGTGYSPQSWLVALLVLSLALYIAGMRRLWARGGAGLYRRAAACYVCGWSALAIALASPVDGMAERLFFVHMIQHELLMLVAAPLLVLGRPLAPFVHALPRGARAWIAPRLYHPRLVRPLALFTRPAVAWTAAAAVLWAWHAPALFNAALASDAVHVGQHASFLVAGILYWWSVLAGRNAGRACIALLSLFLTTLHSNMLGALLTFAPRPWYAYSGQGGLSPLEDQQLGGLIMWVPGGLVFVLAALAIFARVARLPTETTREAAR